MIGVERKSNSPETSGAAVSIVVPTRNEAGTIEACLGAIVRNVPAGLREIIVVDNGSTDGTTELARRFPVRLELVPNGFVSRSRNVGARLASHPIVAFVDSDCVVGEGWYRAVVEVLSDPSVGVTGCRHVLRERPTWVERAWDAAHRPPFEAERADVFYIPAGNMATRRSVMAELDGFDEGIETGEDSDFCARAVAAGHRVVGAQDVRSIHLGEPRTLAEVFRRERWHGRGLKLRYPNGRVAPIAVSTAAFAGLLSAAVAAAIASPVIGIWPALVAALGCAAVAGVYAARYGRRPGHALSLLPVYFAYFLGRSAGLPAALRRAWAGARGLAPPKRLQPEQARSWKVAGGRRTTV